MENKVLVIGGDDRSFLLYTLLKRRGIAADLYGFDKRGLDTVDSLKKIGTYSYIILPIPYRMEFNSMKAPFCSKKIPIDQLEFHKGQTVFLGAVGEEVEFLKDFAGKTVNFLKDTTYVEKNAALTAVITAGLIPLKYGVCPVGKKTLLCGYGRIASKVADLLYSQRAHITVAARSETAKAQILSKGYDFLPIYDLENSIGDFDMVINTVPSWVINKRELKKVKEDCLIIDVASKPGGIDLQTAHQLKVQAFMEPGLPGIYTPKEEAENLLQVVLKHVQEPICYDGRDRLV